VIYTRIIAHLVKAITLGALFYNVGNDASRALNNPALFTCALSSMFYVGVMPTIISCNQLKYCEYTAFLLFYCFSSSPKAIIQRRIFKLLVFSRAILPRYICFPDTVAAVQLQPVYVHCLLDVRTTQRPVHICRIIIFSLHDLPHFQHPWSHGWHNFWHDGELKILKTKYIYEL
jgi:hypothetical protein